PPLTTEGETDSAEMMPWAAAAGGRSSTAMTDNRARAARARMGPPGWLVFEPDNLSKARRNRETGRAGRRMRSGPTGDRLAAGGSRAARRCAVTFLLRYIASSFPPASQRRWGADDQTRPDFRRRTTASEIGGASKS